MFNATSLSIVHDNNEIYLLAQGKDNNNELISIKIKLRKGITDKEIEKLLKEFQ